MFDDPDTRPPFPRRGFLVAAVAFAAAIVPRAAHANRWIPLVRAAIDPAAERTELVVEPASARLRSFRLRARGGAIDVIHVTVVFGNHRRFDIPLRTVITAGGESRAIDLPGDDRRISRVFLRHAPVGGAPGRVEVSAWGFTD
jgi:hypothetical protein